MPSRPTPSALRTASRSATVAVVEYSEPVRPSRRAHWATLPPGGHGDVRQPGVLHCRAIERVGAGATLVEEGNPPARGERLQQGPEPSGGGDHALPGTAAQRQQDRA